MSTSYFHLYQNNLVYIRYCSGNCFNETCGEAHKNCVIVDSDARDLIKITYLENAEGLNVRYLLRARIILEIKYKSAKTYSK